MVDFKPFDSIEDHPELFELDICRVHNVLNGEKIGRGAGYTATIALLLLGQMQLNTENPVVYLYSSYNRLRTFLNTIMKILRHYDIEFQYDMANKKLHMLDNYLMFISMRYPEKLRGLRDTIIWEGE